MMKKKHTTPSRKRYEERNPVIAIRVSAEEKASIEGEAAAVGLSAGELVRRRAHLASATPAQGPPDGGVQETLRKLEIKTTMAVTRRTLSGPAWAEFQNVVEYSSAVAQLEYLEGHAMDLPLGGLEAALPRVLNRVADATGLPALHETVHSWEERLSGLKKNASRWERHNAALAAKDESLRASVHAYEERLAAARKETGMTESEILCSLADYVNLRSTVNWLAVRRNQLTWNCQQAQNSLFQIESRIAEATTAFDRARELRDAEFAALAERMTMNDAFRLADSVAHRENRRMLAELYALVAPTPRLLPGGPPSGPPPTSRSGASVAAQVTVPANRAMEALPTGSPLGPGTSNNGDPPAHSERPPSDQAGNTTAATLPAFEDLFRSILAPPSVAPGPLTGFVPAKNEINKRPSGRSLRPKAHHRPSQHRRTPARAGRTREAHKARNSLRMKRKAKRTHTSAKGGPRTRTKHSRGQR